MVVMKNRIEECLIRLDEVGLTINLAAECWSVGTKSDIKYLTHCCVTVIMILELVMRPGFTSLNLNIVLTETSLCGED